MSLPTQNYRILLIGAGGHATSLLGLIQDTGCTVVGMLADQPYGEHFLRDGKLLGPVSELKAILKEHNDVRLLVAVVDNYQRLRLFETLSKEHPDIPWATIVHPSATVAKDVTIGPGSVVMPGAVLMAGCKVGSACVLNTRCSLDHESVLADGASLAPGAITGGRVHIGSRSSVGLGAIIKHAVSIGKDSVIGAGSLVLNDLPHSIVAYGQPARVVRNRAPDERYL